MKPENLIVLLPTRGRPEMLHSVLRDLVRTEGDFKVAILHDGELPDAGWSWIEAGDQRFERITTSTQRGYWDTCNIGLRITERPSVLFLANDLRLHEGWLEALRECWNVQFPDGLGLMAVRDGIHDGQHCTHGLTTRAWLVALYGAPFFASYRHHYGDSELTQFSQDLGGFGYCERAFLEHLHPSTGKREPDEVDQEAVELSNPVSARGLYDARYAWWDRLGGRKAAQERLAQLQAALKGDGDGTPRAK